MHDINYTNLRKNLVVDRINGANSSFPLPHSWGNFSPPFIKEGKGGFSFFLLM